MILAIDAFDTCLSRSILISVSLPSSRDGSSEPFGRPGGWPLALAAASPSRVRSAAHLLDLDDLPNAPPQA